MGVKNVFESGVHQLPLVSCVTSRYMQHFKTKALSALVPGLLAVQRLMSSHAYHRGGITIKNLYKARLFTLACNLKHFCHRIMSAGARKQNKMNLSAGAVCKNFIKVLQIARDLPRTNKHHHKSMHISNCKTNPSMSEL